MEDWKNGELEVGMELSSLPIFQLCSLPYLHPTNLP